MGMFYQIFRLLQEQDERSLTRDSSEKVGEETEEEPMSLIELLAKPIGSRLPDDDCSYSRVSAKKE